MGMIDILNRAKSVLGSPVVDTLESAAGAAAASFFPAAAPVIAEVEAGVNVAKNVVNTAQAAAAGTPTPPLTPVAPAAPDGTDAAALAAAGVAANPAADPVIERLNNHEQILLDIIELLAKVAKELGL